MLWGAAAVSAGASGASESSCLELDAGRRSLRGVGGGVDMGMFGCLSLPLLKVVLWKGKQPFGDKP